MQKALRDRLQPGARNTWRMLFYPRGFALEHQIESLEPWRLKEKQLEEIGKAVTKLREQIRQRATILEGQGQAQQPGGAQTLSSIVKKTRSGQHERQLEREQRQARAELKEETPSQARKKGKQRRLSLEQKVEAAWMVFVQMEKQADVARHFRVSAWVISKLMSGIRKKPALLSELLSRKQDAEATRAAIQAHVETLVDSHAVIDSVEGVRQHLQQSQGLTVQTWDLRKVMTEDLGLTYRKIKEVAVHENSVRNLVLRQQFALRYLDLAMTKTRIINIDETWLGMEDFRRMKWQAPGTNNSVSKKQWQPRISLILALDNYGESYVALTQVNTDHEMISLFMRDLVRQLNEQSRNWRKNTLIFWDGAAYHQKPETMQMLEQLQVPIMISGPHSYDAAPCELWFALFKSVNINPRKVKTGKR